VASFSDARLRAIRSGNDEVLTSAGQLEVAQLRLLGRINRRIRCVQVPVSAGPITVVTPKFLAAAHRNGIEVHVWTIDDPAQMRELLSLGVDGIVTDRPDLALRVMTSADSSLPTPLSTSSDQVSRNP
jgi:glycerophosphoryl diester phosphodiesterase